MKRSINCWCSPLKAFLLLTVVAVSGCNVWIFPDEEGGDQSTAVVDQAEQVEVEQQGETTKPVATDIATDIPEFNDGRLRIALWRESDNARMPRWMVLLQNGERWDSWVAANRAEYRIWDPQQVLNRRESAGWKKVLQAYKPKSLPSMVVFKGSKCVANGPPQFTSTKPADQVEDFIKFCESVAKPAGK